MVKGRFKTFKKKMKKMLYSRKRVMVLSQLFIYFILYYKVLWEEEREETKDANKQSFVDLGCGNGLLTHILISEGVSD